jgi:hypothetical protein
MRRFDLMDDVHEGARMVEHPEGAFVLYSDIADVAKQTQACSACNGFGSELTVYHGKILCRECGSQKVDEKTRANLWSP